MTEQPYTLLLTLVTDQLRGGESIVSGKILGSNNTVHHIRPDTIERNLLTLTGFMQLTLFTSFDRVFFIKREDETIKKFLIVDLTGRKEPVDLGKFIRVTPQTTELSHVA